jgi:PAS domain S-box-containing protein
MKTLSFRRRLLAGLLITSASALLLTVIAFVIHEFSTYKQATARGLLTLARTVAANSAGALAFENENDAREILSGLRSEPSIVAACLYDASGKPFVNWCPGGGSEPFPPRPGPDGLRFERNELTVFEPVIQAEGRLGTLYVREDLSGFYSRIAAYAGFAVLVLAVSAVLAAGLARFFGERLTRPVLSLAGVARQVSELKDFSLRAAPTGTTDELGQLTNAFNEMLLEIQTHQRQLTDELAARRKAEADLRESEERFRTLADNIDQLAWMADKLGWATWYNKRWYEYTGTNFAQMKERGWEGLQHPDHVARVRAKLQRCLERGEPWEDTFPLRGKDGRFRWFLSRAVPIRDHTGAVVRWFGTNTDIDEQKRAAEKLEQAVTQRTAELREANENLQTFSYTAAHDLRSPLRTISAFSALVLDEFKGSLPPDAAQYMARVKASASQMERLLTDLLEYSRIAQADLHPEPVSLQNAVQEAVALLDADIKAKHAVLAIDKPLPVVRGHPATLVTLIQNFLANALKFMPEGVEPRIRIYSEQVAGEVEDSGGHGPVFGPNGIPDRSPDRSGPTKDASAPLTFIRLSVEDNGIGIDPRNLHRLFTAFERLNDRRLYPGTGLGLAIVRKAVERLGGRVGVQSEPGKGSRFWIDLPPASQTKSDQPSAA